VAVAVTGRTLSATPKMTMTTMPDTNSGTVAADSPVSEMTRSIGEPTRSAEMTPPAMPSGTITTSANRASFAEFASAEASSGSTGVRYW
jgi:hypothetical protein